MDAQNISVDFVNEQNGDGDTALHLAIAGDADMGVLRSLLEKGADVNVTNNRGETPLDKLQHGYVQTALTLLRLERDFDFRDGDGNTLLHQLMDRLGDHIWGVVRTDDMDTGDIGQAEQDQLISEFWAEILRDKGSFIKDINILNEARQTILHIAADFWPSSKHLEVLLNEFPDIDSFAKDSDGDTFLHVYLRRYSEHEGSEFDNSLFEGHLKYLSKSVLQTLLNTKNYDLDTPLHSYIKGTSSNINACSMRKFMNAGCDVNIRDRKGETALHAILKLYNDPTALAEEAAYEAGYVRDFNETEADDIKLLVQVGADVKMENDNGETPLFLAVFIESINALLDSGADVNHRNRLKQTPLLVLVCRPDIKIQAFKCLLNRGADVNAQDVHGSNIFHYLAWHGRYQELLPIITSYKAELSSAPDANGCLPCHVAHFQGHKEMFDYLCHCGKGEHREKEHFCFRRMVLQNVNKIPKEALQKMEFVAQRFSAYRGKNMVNLANLPGLSLVVFQDEAQGVKSVVNDLVRRISSKIKEDNELLTVSLIESGSVAEDTKVGLPNEFDFICLFDKFAEICRIEDQNLEGNTDFVKLRLKDKFNREDYGDLFDEERILDTFQVRLQFWEALEAVLKTSETFDHPNISYLKHHFKGANSPTFHFTIRWVGCTYKHMNIDIDLVPACHFKGYWPPDAGGDICESLKDEVKVEGAVVMLQTELDTDFNPLKKQRLSAILAEKRLMSSIPDVARKAYVVSKILLNDRLCPVMTVGERGARVGVRDVFNSYILKNCMLHAVYSTNSSFSQSRNMNEEAASNDSLFDLVLRIFKKLLDFLKQGNLPSFIFPWQNVLEFDLKLEPNDIVYYRPYRCAFAKILLAILGERWDLDDILEDLSDDDESAEQEDMDSYSD